MRITLGILVALLGIGATIRVRIMRTGVHFYEWCSPFHPQFWLWIRDLIEPDPLSNRKVNGLKVAGILVDKEQFSWLRSLRLRRAQ